jgi:hypothetical protein
VSHLLRVSLPDVPGSLGRVASAIGLAGGNIEAIEIVEHRSDGVAVDDVFLSMADGVMPDSVVSACTQLDGVEVIWIQRYGAGGGLFLDLELVEEMTNRRADARNVLVDALPSTFRVDWAARLRPEAGGIGVVRRTTAAPESIPAEVTWPETLTHGMRLQVPEPWDSVIAAGCPLGHDGDLVVIARRGGPAILDSEIARLSHLCALADSIAGADGA